MVNSNTYKSKGTLTLALAALAVIIFGVTLFAPGCAADQSGKTADNAKTTTLEDEGKEKTAGMPNETRGNTTGNIVQGGFVAESEGWFYFCMPDDTKLMKMNADGSDLQILVDEDAMYINVIGDWLYYATHGVGIVKVRTDGTERTIVDAYAASLYVNVVDDWIYYYDVLNFGTDSGIYKVGLDGEEKTLLSDMSGYDLNIVGDWIYFSNWDDDQRPYKMDLEGIEAVRLAKDEAYKLQVYGNMVYYSDAISIHRVGIDGSNRTVLDRDIYIISNFLIDDGWIYFFFPTRSSLDAYNLLRMNPDTSEIETLQEIAMPEGRTGIKSFNIAGGWIFFHAFSVDDDYELLSEALYRVRTDGSGFEKVMEAK